MAFELGCPAWAALQPDLRTSGNTRCGTSAELFDSRNVMESFELGCPAGAALQPDLCTVVCSGRRIFTDLLQSRGGAAVAFKLGCPARSTLEPGEWMIGGLGMCDALFSESACDQVA